MNMTKRLYKAIEAYYKNRARQGVAPWDKTADLEAIQDAIRQSSTKYHFEAVAGAFYFSHNTKRHRVTWQTSEAAFPGFTRTRKRLDKEQIP